MGVSRVEVLDLPATVYEIAQYLTQSIPSAQIYKDHVPCDAANCVGVPAHLHSQNSRLYA